MSSKTLYRVRNWRAYHQALVDRGNITVWFAPEAIKGWQSERRHNGRGRPEEFSDAAIECCLVLRSLFHLPLRATQGFIEGIVHLLSLDIEVPHYTLLCKRIVYWVLSADYNFYRDIQQSINFSILRRLTNLGVSFAYPTRTVPVASSNSEASNALRRSTQVLEPAQ